jgi:uncharacterized protein YjbK
VKILSQNIEIEFKNLLTKSEYNMLLREFQINEEKIIVQENHYFDTKDFALKKKETALRIRQKKNQFEMTLKQPAPVGILETNQILTEEDALNAIQSGILPSGRIEDLLTAIKIPISQLIYFGLLKTYRAELNYMNGMLVLDHSLYLNQEDFELEFEVMNYQQGQKDFKEFLEQYEIPERRTDNKIRRFYKKMINLHSQSDLFEI